MTLSRPSPSEELENIALDLLKQQKVDGRGVGGLFIGVRQGGS